MIPSLDSTLVLSQKRINLVRQGYGPWAIGNVDNDGFRTIRNPFNLQKCDEDEANATPLYLKIPEFVESEQTLQFMGFNHVTARLIWRKYRSTSEQRPLAEDLICCALQFLAYIEAQATGREGSRDQYLIKERMGFHHQVDSTTFLHIDKNSSPPSPLLLLPPTYYTATTNNSNPNPYFEEPRVIFWITAIISRRYDFIYRLEETIGSRLRILHWSNTTYARNFDNYSPAALRDGVDSWFDYIAGLKKALEPLNGGTENVAIDLIAFMLERFCANV